MSGSAVRAYVDEQSLWRPAEHYRAARAFDALGVRRSGVRQRYSRDVFDRSINAFHFWSIEGCRRRHGARIWALVRYAHVLFTWRVFDRAEPLRRRGTR